MFAYFPVAVCTFPTGADDMRKHINFGNTSIPEITYVHFVPWREMDKQSEIPSSWQQQ